MNRGVFLQGMVAGSCIATIVTLLVTDLSRDPISDPKPLDRACTLAAGNVRATLPWLTPGHARREAGLLLLARDAAWAPVCARDRGAGAKLRLEIDGALGQPDAPGAVSLATRLIVVLEDR